MNLQSLIRPHIRALKAYSSARDEYTGKVGTFLDANENALGSVADGPYNRYPDPHQRAVKTELARLRAVQPEQVFLGNGSDEAIDLLFRAFCEPGKDEVLLMPPTYGMYQVSADLNQIPARKVPLTNNFQLDLPNIQAALSPNTKLIFLCSPNNPTGNCLKAEDVKVILESAPGLVIVDEAYIDFAQRASVLSWLAEYPNLVVLQTFSKAWGMAGLRLGMAFAHPEIIAVMTRIKPPYNVNLLTQELAIKALSNHEKQQEMVAATLAERARMAESLGDLDFVAKVFPSDANFLLVKVPEPDQMYDRLIGKRIIIRNRSKVLLCEGCLRITVGTKIENDAFLTAFSALGNEIEHEKTTYT
ncbi:MAG: histidinol-phosphate transaminase [Bacteroidota bacterium]